MRAACSFALLLTGFWGASASASGVTEFCLVGELDLGVRYQGSRMQAGEFYPTTWCVISEDDSDRVVFSGSGRSNPDMDGSWTVAYLPPATVRIVNREAPPDVLFVGADSRAEALGVRRLDPRRLVEERRSSPAALGDLAVAIEAGRLESVTASADLPLRGRVSVEWHWDWAESERPAVRLLVDGELLFKAIGAWRELSEEEAATLWVASPGAEPIEVAGEHWPARVDPKLTTLADGVHLVTGVRTGFQHLVVETSPGLVVADAPAGWVELHQLPPSDLVPGLGISGLSERLLDFLQQELPGRDVYANVLTHFHDDHAGGARAFAAVGARVFAPQQSAEAIEQGLNRSAMPRDRFSVSGRPVSVVAVSDTVTIGNGATRVDIVSLGRSPHVEDMLAVYAVDSGYFFVSDVHVPRSDADTPRADRAGIECWFAEWAVGHLPPEVLVINSHSSPATPVARLARYLESDLCRD